MSYVICNYNIVHTNWLLKKPQDADLSGSRSKACTLDDRSNTGTVPSNPIRAIGSYLHFFCICLCV
jgi:hypothetical protein